MTFGKWIRQRRKQLGLSLRDAAQRTGVDVAYLSRVESEAVPPSEQLACKLATVLKCTEDELLLLAGHLPKSIRAMSRRNPRQVASALRSLARGFVAEGAAPYGPAAAGEEGRRAIEDGFPFEAISEIAEIESWRKEVYRPIYHVHKWWAQRLGSVFRAAILGAAAPSGASVMDLFYQPVRLSGVVVFDPFMGSGTTVGEAHKLGCAAIGRDINPVACRAVRTALNPVSRQEVAELFGRLQRSVGRQLLSLYQGRDSRGQACDVLYYFWVKVVQCPACSRSVDLFSTYAFARHADARRKPTVQVVCPKCGAISPGTHGASEATCKECGAVFNPYQGPAKRTTAVCGHCGHEFPIARTARESGGPPPHRMYAKLVLRQDGVKEYLPTTKSDLQAFEQARRQLASLNPPLPQALIKDGYNTRQILNYGYRRWRELFNERQLLALALLAQAISDLPAGPAREALATLFSGVLEFNNMFASYKGEGTGAVRHMFSHHILKPERMPIEANVWGTPKSSGAFSTLYESRLLRALDYMAAPFEVAVEYEDGKKKGRKVIGLSPPMGTRILDSYPKKGLEPGNIYLSCGSSAGTDLPDSSVHLVVTDPPFFDNVHYSELADFFHVWQQLYFGKGRPGDPLTTRQAEEVQDVDPAQFAEKLKKVFSECHRVLRDDGLLVFSYHHSREDGWSSLARAVLGAGFSLVQCQPVKSEMSVAAPKRQTREPIDIDVLMVCRKRARDLRPRLDANATLVAAADAAKQKVTRFNRAGRRLSRSDVRVVLLSHLLAELSAGRSCPEVEAELASLLGKARLLVERIWHGQDVKRAPAASVRSPQHTVQLGLFV